MALALLAAACAQSPTLSAPTHASRDNGGGGYFGGGGVVSAAADTSSRGGTNYLGSGN
jgi:hypothetical protein